MTEELLRTPLYETHINFGARMVEFAGWSMPISYTSITEEHVHTRTACSMFDVSHMGRLKITGDDAGKFLNYLCTRNLENPEVGRCYYTHMCREDGGILDDVIVSRFETHWGVVCNASNRDKVVAWMDKHKKGFDIAVDDETLTTAMLAFQGPRTIPTAEELAKIDLSGLKRYRFFEREFGGAKIIVYRSGYTGEDGLEVVAPAPLVKNFIGMLIGTQEKPHPVIRPAGLGARDTLRIEAAMPLYGHELSEEVDSLTAGQAWCVNLEGDFIGAEAMRKLKEQGLPRQLVGLELEGRRIARQHQRVFVGGDEIGEVTSGTLSPTLGKSIAMALVKPEHAALGQKLIIEIGSRRVDATVVKLPFYKRPK